MEAEGADPNSVKFIEVPFPEMPAALEKGRVDAIWAPEPFLTQVLGAGGNEVLPVYQSLGPLFPNGAYATTDEYIAKNEKVVEGFARAINKALKYATDNPEEARKTITTFTKIPPDVVQKIRLPLWPTEIDREQLTDLIGYTQKYGVIEKTFPVEDMIWEGAKQGLTWHIEPPLRSAPTTSAASCAPTGSARRTPRTRPARIDDAGLQRRRGRRDPRGRRATARSRAPGRHRRRVPPHLVAHGLHLLARRRQPGRGREPCTCSSATRRASTTTRRPRCAWTARSPCPATARSSATRSSFLRDTVQDGVTAKLTVPSPSMVHYRGGNSSIDESAYPDIEEFWSDLTTAYAEQAQRVHALGCRYLQLDDTSLAYINDPAQREHIEAIGGDPEHLHEQYIANINRALAGKPDDLAITTHLCRGNHRSVWVASGGYDPVAQALFGDLEVNGIFLEYDDARSARSSRLSSRRRASSRARARHHQAAAARGQGPAQAPDRGGRAVRRCRPALHLGRVRFLVHLGGQPAHEDDQLAKLRLIVEVADEVWG